MTIYDKCDYEDDEDKKNKLGKNIKNQAKFTFMTLKRRMLFNATNLERWEFWLNFRRSQLILS